MSQSKALTPLQEISNTLEAMTEKFQAALPSHIEPSRFIQIVKTAISKQPKLLEADRRSLWVACMAAAESGLLPDGKQAAFVPYRTKTGTIVQYQPMEQGLKSLVWKTGKISSWLRETVKENDSFDFELGSTPYIKHKRALKNRGEIIAAYSIVTMSDGTRSYKLIDRDDIEKSRSRSKQPDGAWKTDPERMAEKTVARLHYKDLPSSLEYDREFNKFDDEHAETFDAETAEPTQEKASSLETLAGIVEEQTTTGEEIPI